MAGTPGPLAPEPTRFTRCLDGCLLNVGDSAFHFVGVLGADGNESGGAQDAVSRGEAGFLLENVVVLGALLRVDEGARPFADPEHAVVRGVAAHARLILGDRDRALAALTLDTFPRSATGHAD